jgi:hypothetical protein
MSNEALPPALQALAGKRDICADDVTALRRSFYGDGAITRAEAEAILSLDGMVDRAAPEWADFLMESVTDHVVRQVDPEGYVSRESAEWLLAAVSRDGLVRSVTALELLIHVLEAAVSAPPGLSAAVLSQVCAAVLEGEGPLAKGRREARGVISRDEVEILRRTLHAAGSPAALAVSREEADVLFDLNERSVEAENDPAWSELFVKAIASHVMAPRGHEPPTREDALRREAWLEAPAEGTTDILGGALSSLMAGRLRSTWTAWRQDEEQEESRGRARDIELAAAEAVTADEAAWLAGRLGKGGVLGENEKALLRFLRAESPLIDPRLRALMDRAA